MPKHFEAEFFGGGSQSQCSHQVNILPKLYPHLLQSEALSQIC
jgi:hypothetical protein